MTNFTDFFRFRNIVIGMTICRKLLEMGVSLRLLLDLNTAGQLQSIKGIVRGV